MANTPTPRPSTATSCLAGGGPTGSPRGPSGGVSCPCELLAICLLLTSLPASGSKGKASCGEKQSLRSVKDALRGEALGSASWGASWLRNRPNTERERERRNRPFAKKEEEKEAQSSVLGLARQVCGDLSQGWEALGSRDQAISEDRLGLRHFPTNTHAEQAQPSQGLNTPARPWWSCHHCQGLTRRCFREPRYVFAEGLQTLPAELRRSK